MEAEALTDEDKIVFREAFIFFDRDGSEHVTTNNMANVLRSTGQAPTEKEMGEYIKEVDPENTGKVPYQIFLGLYARIMKNTVEMDDDLSKAFRVLDEDKDGKIPVNELKHFLTTIGETLSEEEVDELIREADVQSDGKINYEELVIKIINEDQSN